MPTGIPLPTEGIFAVITKILDYFIGAGLVVALVSLVYGGYLYMASAGDEKAVTKAKRALTGSIMGLILVIMSYAVIKYIQYIVLK